MEGITAKQRNQDLMIWEILSLSRLQKMIKLGESFLGKACCGEKVKGVAGQLLLVLKEIRRVIHGSIQLP